MPNKPIICIDFDGVIHSYENGWQNGVIYGSCVPGFFEWAVEAQKIFKLVVYSSRSKSAEGLRDMQSAIFHWYLGWNKENGRTGESMLPLKLEYSAEKPPAFLTVDDRALQFRGNWRDPRLEPEALKTFRPWNAQD